MSNILKKRDTVVSGVSFESTLMQDGRVVFDLLRILCQVSTEDTFA